MRMIRTAIAGILTLLAVATASAQVPQFPQTLPANTVIGRLGTGSGPSQAIPFSLLGISSGPQSANKVMAGPTSGVAAAPGFRSLVGADLPTPGASSLGGAQSLTCSTSNWFNTLSTGGVFGCSQPSFTNLSGNIAVSQMNSGTGASSTTFWRGDGTWATLVIPAGVDQNILNSQTANYTIATTDCGSRIQAGTGSTGSFTVTLPAVSGFATTCRVSVLNGDTGRGKKLSGFPSPAPAILYPKQEIDVAIVNGAWALVDQPARWRLTAAVTLNVDPTNGNDTNDGLATGTGNALATVQKAWDTICDQFDMASQLVTIQLVDGTYTAGIITSKSTVGSAGGTGVTINGNAGARANVLFSMTSASAFFFGSGAVGNAQVTIQNLKMTTSGSGNGIDSYGSGTSLAFNNIECGAMAGACISTAHGSEIAGHGPAAITGNISAFMQSVTSSRVSVDGITVTCTGSPAFSLAFAYNSHAETNAGSMTFTSCGTATGNRYSVSGNGVIATGGGATYFPGSVAGAAATGGQYF